MTVPFCRFGILSTAGIARKNWKAIHLSGNACVSAVASRSPDAAKRFIQQCSREVPLESEPRAFGSYQEMLESDLVDAVYVPVPTARRHEWVIKAAEAGKHVIGEKPAAVSAAQLQEMLDACRQHSVQYMDGVMFMHSQRLPLVRRLVDGEAGIGSLRRLASQFCFAGDQAFERSNIRVNSQLEPHGCLGDLGWYCIRIFEVLTKYRMPAEVRGRTLHWLKGDASSDPVPGEFSGELLFDDGVSATFYCSFRTQHQQWVHVSGSGGYLRIDDFVLPYRGAELVVHSGRDHFMIDNCTFHMEHHPSRYSVHEYDAGHHSAQETRMIRAFSEAVLSKSLNPQWSSWALNTQRIMDACFQSAKNDGLSVAIK